MSSLIEDMARAMMDADKDAFGYDELAKAALAVVLTSLREPSEEMIEAVCTAIECEPNSSEAQGRAAIKALLSQWAKEQGIE